MSIYPHEHKKPDCLIVDDEPMARDVLRRYIDKLPFISLAGECSNAIDTLVFLQSQPVDLLFLDIRMPELLGTELIQTLSSPPKVIFTTAFKEYALDGFELDAVDYLLKPIRFDRFLKAVNKAFPGREVQTAMLESNNIDQKNSDNFIYVRVERKLVKIILNDLLYIESDRDYVKIYLVERSYITRQTISSIETMLDEKDFVRIHRSFIISLSKIQSFNNEFVEIGSKELPIGKLYRNQFMLKVYP